MTTAIQARGLVKTFGRAKEESRALDQMNLHVQAGSIHGLARRAARARAGELLERFSLSEVAHKTSASYSGGMRRRLDVAASLVITPAVLVLDEPTTGLDPRSRTQTWELIQEVVAQGSTLLLTTQYLEEADQLADAITVIDHGKVIAEGTSSELKSRIGGERIQLTLARGADIPQAQRLLAENQAEPVSIDVDGHTLTASAPQGAASFIQALRTLDAAQIELLDLALRRPTLDDVFLTLTGQPRNTGSEDGATSAVPSGSQDSSPTLNLSQKDSP